MHISLLAGHPWTPAPSKAPSMPFNAHVGSGPVVAHGYPSRLGTGTLVIGRRKVATMRLPPTKENLR